MSKITYRSINLFILIFSLFLGSCSSPFGSGKKRTSITSTATGANSASTVSPGYGRVFRQNPILLSGNEELLPDIDFNTLLDFTTEDFITNSPDLNTSCRPNPDTFTANPSIYFGDDTTSMISDLTQSSSFGLIGQCLKVLKNKNSPPLLPNDGTWAYDANTSEFLEVNTFYHTNLVISRFQDVLFWAYKLTHPVGIFGGGKYETAIPAFLYQNGASWDSSQLIVYSSCEDIVDNAAFFPSSGSICLGISPDIPGFSISQDSDITYHEAAHALVKIMINQRNVARPDITSLRTDLGYSFYDEGGALNEGIADFFTYLITQLPHFSKWGAGRFFGASRPLTESDPLHIEGVSTDEDSRLAYPQFLLYDPNDPSFPVEDIHQAGQIIGHFLVALTEELKSTCSMGQVQASNVVLYLINETLAEIGDLTSTGTDTASEERVNLTPTNSEGNVSKLWAEGVTPMNFRRFFQTFAKFFNYAFSPALPTISCTSGSEGKFSQDMLEELLDEYGLLLFKSYNDDGSGINSGHTEVNNVTAINRRRTVLINKDKLILDNSVGSSKAFIFDGQSDINDLVSNLKAQGVTSELSPIIPSDLRYNNSNGQISPGELLGISLNLFNNSNYPMAGVQVLANDWDQGKVEDDQLKPCPTFSDNWPPTSAGAASTNSGTPVQGDCEYITRLNGGDESFGVVKEVLSPVCWVEEVTDNETIWVSQEEKRKELGLTPEQCLIPPENGIDPVYDCLVRIVPGADRTFFSRIDPQKNWGKTVAPDGTTPSFNSSHIFLMEVNKWIPPGTSFECRFRARFTNCNDCWHDPDLNDTSLTPIGPYQDDYLDYEYSGAEPFTILHMNFTVID